LLVAFSSPIFLHLPMVPFAQVYVMLQERRNQTTKRDMDD
jgi:hypothetical protein